MNILFLSPHYPPYYENFCRALRDRGCNVLGIGDREHHELAPGLQHVLSDYVHVHDMNHYDELLRATGLLVHRHGRIAHIDSLNEHYLESEAQLREDFNVEGMRPRETLLLRRKSGMAQVLAEHGIKGPPSFLVRAGTCDAAEAFAKEHGYPLILKPDVGVAAEMTVRIDDADAYAKAMKPTPHGFVLQKFIKGKMTTFDGLTDHDGRIIFASSFVYSTGVLETIRDRLDFFYYTRRTMPPALKAMGEGVVRAFDLKARFFHGEFFETEDGTIVPLEINLRPAGGYSLDLMNYAHDIDLYSIWARIITNDDVEAIPYEAKYHSAHVARRERAYRLPHHEVPALAGSALMGMPHVPPGIAHAMGNPIYLLRHAEEKELLRIIESIQAVA